MYQGLGTTVEYDRAQSKAVASAKIFFVLNVTIQVPSVKGWMRNKNQSRDGCGIRIMGIYDVLDQNIPPRYHVRITGESQIKRLYEVLNFSHDIAREWSQAMWEDVRNRNVWQIWSKHPSLSDGNYHMEVLPCMGYIIFGEEIFSVRHSEYRNAFKNGELESMGCTFVTELLQYCSGSQCWDFALLHYVSIVLM
jgi:hypothetical protein